MWETNKKFPTHHLFSTWSTIVIGAILQSPLVFSRRDGESQRKFVKKKKRQEMHYFVRKK